MKKGIDMFEKECVEEVEPGKVRCRAGKTSIWINKKGEMSLCGIIDKAFDINVLGFSEDWKEVKEYTLSITLPIKCQTCKYRHFYNVCATVCYTETARITQLEAEKLRNELSDLKD